MRVLEKTVQRDVIKNAKTFGCEVVSFSQPFGALQTRGIADLRIYHRDRNQAAWFEVKTPTGKQSPGQVAFQSLVEAVGERFEAGSARSLVISSPRQAELRLIRSGELVAEAVGERLEVAVGELPKAEGRREVFRAEARLNGHPWVFSNPIYGW